MDYIGKSFDEERALYGVHGVRVINCNFDGKADGESALKEASDIFVDSCFFNLRYPLWHVNGCELQNFQMTEYCRAALWYDSNVKILNGEMLGIKALRECTNVSLENCTIKSPEFLWKCSDVKINQCTLESEYPFFECKNMKIEQFTLQGKYSFQYAENVYIKNSELNTKDAFWHSKNVTVEDSVLKGEYLGWYSENLRLVRCRIIGTQSLCYCKNLVLEDCVMENTDLSFEKSSVNADVKGSIVSVKNPLGGVITADSIGEIILDYPTECKIVSGAEVQHG